MKTLYLECNMGAAGDMLTGALLELYGDRQKFIDMMNNAGIEGVSISAEDNFKCGIKGTKVSVSIDGIEESAGNHENHHHASYKSILRMIDTYNIPNEVKASAKDIYRIIGASEAYVHNTDIENIHFHEVGTLDAVADVVGCCLLMHIINPQKVIVSPVNTGSGTVHCAHGILPVPAPATSRILEGVPIYAGKTESELCTPTGAAIIKYFADEFSKMPVMVCEKTGYGMGTKDFETANCVRAFLGETDDDNDNDNVISIQCNLDDMTGEALGYACDLLLKNGALDVFTVPVYMKKNRPGILLVCICEPEIREVIIKLILQETTTRGVRFCEMERRVMDYSFFEIETEFGRVKVKKSNGYGIEKCKPEFESVREVANRRGVPFNRVYNNAVKNIMKQ